MGYNIEFYAYLPKVWIYFFLHIALRSDPELDPAPDFFSQLTRIRFREKKMLDPYPWIINRVGQYLPTSRNSNIPPYKIYTPVCTSVDYCELFGIWIRNDIHTSVWPKLDPVNHLETIFLQNINVNTLRWISVTDPNPVGEIFFKIWWIRKICRSGS